MSIKKPYFKKDVFLPKDCQALKSHLSFWIESTRQDFLKNFQKDSSRSDWVALRSYLESRNFSGVLFPFYVPEQPKFPSLTRSHPPVRVCFRRKKLIKCVYITEFAQEIPIFAKLASP